MDKPTHLHLTCAAARATGYNRSDAALIAAHAKEVDRRCLHLIPKGHEPTIALLSGLKPHVAWAAWIPFSMLPGLFGVSGATS